MCGEIFVNARLTSFVSLNGLHVKKKVHRKGGLKLKILKKKIHKGLDQTNLFKFVIIKLPHVTILCLYSGNDIYIYVNVSIFVPVYSVIVKGIIYIMFVYYLCILL